MKIFILTFLFCLLPFNLNAQALLSNCYDSSRSSSFNAQGINEEDKIEINENKTILRRTQIRLDSAIKKNPEWGKVHAQTYKINYFDDNIINAETLSPSKTKLQLEVDIVMFFCYSNNSGFIPASSKLLSYVSL